MKKTILFIVGLGHSGSTILDMALGSHPDAFSLGEIVHLPSQMLGNIMCVCGKSTRDCPFWLKVNDKLRARYHCDLLKDPHAFNLALDAGAFGENTIIRLMNKGLFLTRGPEVLTDHPWIMHTKALYEAVFSVSGAHVLIDSTKFLNRALLLGSVLKEYQVRFIHLIRDCRGIVASLMRDTYSVVLPGRKERQGFPRKSCPPKKSVPIWIYGNLKITLLLSLLIRPGHWKMVRYEDFCDQPEVIFPDLAKWLNLTYHEDMIRFGMSEHHNIWGNPSRFNSKCIRPAERKWKTQLSEPVIRMVNRRAGIFNRLYGFGNGTRLSPKNEQPCSEPQGMTHFK